jgi:ribosomal protein S20
MSRSKNQHKSTWDFPKRYLKKSTKSKMRSAEKRFLHRLKNESEYFEESVEPDKKELDDIWNYD